IRDKTRSNPLLRQTDTYGVPSICPLEGLFCSIPSWHFHPVKERRILSFLVGDCRSFGSLPWLDVLVVMLKPLIATSLDELSRKTEMKASFAVKGGKQSKNGWFLGSHHHQMW
ncbi:Unknown protein, partial [Striga hermonthica]